MSIDQIPYVNPTRRGDGEQSDGRGWAPIQTSDFAGWSTGELRHAYVLEVYAGPGSWGDGSDPVAKVSRTMPPWRVRNALRRVKPEFMAVKASLETEIADEVGGVYVPDPPAPWMDGPMEAAPEPEAPSPPES